MASSKHLIQDMGALGDGYFNTRQLGSLWQTMFNPSPSLRSLLLLVFFSWACCTWLTNARKQDAWWEMDHLCPPIVQSSFLCLMCLLLDRRPTQVACAEIWTIWFLISKTFRLQSSLFRNSTECGGCETNRCLNSCTISVILVVQDSSDGWFVDGGLWVVGWWWVCGNRNPECGACADKPL